MASAAPSDSDDSSDRKVIYTPPPPSPVILNRPNTMTMYCWKCGIGNHLTADCPSPQMYSPNATGRQAPSVVAATQQQDTPVKPQAQASSAMIDRDRDPRLTAFQATCESECQSESAVPKINDGIGTRTVKTFTIPIRGIAPVPRAHKVAEPKGQTIKSPYNLGNDVWEHIWTKRKLLVTKKNKTEKDHNDLKLLEEDMIKVMKCKLDQSRDDMSYPNDIYSWAPATPLMESSAQRTHNPGWNIPIFNMLEDDYKIRSDFLICGTCDLKVPEHELASHVQSFAHLQKREEKQQQVEDSMNASNLKEERKLKEQKTSALVDKYRRDTTNPVANMQTPNRSFSSWSMPQSYDCWGVAENCYGFGDDRNDTASEFPVGCGAHDGRAIDLECTHCKPSIQALCDGWGCEPGCDDCKLPISDASFWDAISGKEKSQHAESYRESPSATGSSASLRFGAAAPPPLTLWGPDKTSDAKPQSQFCESCGASAPCIFHQKKQYEDKIVDGVLSLLYGNNKHIGLNDNDVCPKHNHARIRGSACAECLAFAMISGELSGDNAGLGWDLGKDTQSKHAKDISWGTFSRPFSFKPTDEPADSHEKSDPKWEVGRYWMLQAWKKGKEQAKLKQNLKDISNSTAASPEDDLCRHGWSRKRGCVECLNPSNLYDDDVDFDWGLGKYTQDTHAADTLWGAPSRSSGLESIDEPAKRGKKSDAKREARFLRLQKQNFVNICVLRDSPNNSPAGELWGRQKKDSGKAKGCLDSSSYAGSPLPLNRPKPVSTASGWSDSSDDESDSVSDDRDADLDSTVSDGCCDGWGCDGCGKLIVFNLSLNVDEDWLSSTFAPWGKVQNCRINCNPVTGRSRRFGLVDFADVEVAKAAKKALNGSYVDKHPLLIKFANPENLKAFKARDHYPVEGASVQDESDKGCASNAIQSVFVGNLTCNVDEEWLSYIFSDYGEVLGCRVIRDPTSGRSKGFGYVDYIDVNAAMKANEGLHNTDLASRPLSIKFNPGNAEHVDAPHDNPVRVASEKNKSNKDDVSECNSWLRTASGQKESDKDDVSECSSWFKTASSSSTYVASSKKHAETPVSKDLHITYWITVESGNREVHIPIEPEQVSGQEKDIINNGMKKVWQWAQDKKLDDKMSLQDAFDLAQTMHGGTKKTGGEDQPAVNKYDAWWSGGEHGAGAVPWGPASSVTPMGGTTSEEDCEECGPNCNLHDDDGWDQYRPPKIFFPESDC